MVIIKRRGVANVSMGPWAIKEFSKKREKISESDLSAGLI
jgi:hypothetical protein